MSEGKLTRTLPHYYLVDDVPVHLELEGGEVVGITGSKIRILSKKR